MIDHAHAQTTQGTAPAAPAPGAAGAQAGPSMFGAFFPFILIMVLFYFLLVVPQNKEKKKREAMLSAIKPGDRVLTQGGVYGTVANVNTETSIVTLKIAENTKIEVGKGYIISVENPKVDEKKS